MSPLKDQGDILWEKTKVSADKHASGYLLEGHFITQTSGIEITLSMNNYLF